MPSTAVELLGFFLGLLGMVGTLVVTMLPNWKTSAYVGPNIVTALDQMKGLWMECVYQSTGIFQCEMYTSMLALPSDLQAARAMMVISTVFSVLGCVIAVLGMQCTLCLDGSQGKTKVAGVGGCFFLLAGFFCLVPVSWITHEVVRTFYQPNLPSSYKHEIGECLYAGLCFSLLSMLGGTALCFSCCDAQGEHMGSTRPGSSYPYLAHAPGVAPRPSTLQPGINKHQGRGRASSSSSQHSSGPGPSAKLIRHNKAPGYHVTGYV